MQTNILVSLIVELFSPEVSTLFRDVGVSARTEATEKKKKNKASSSEGFTFLHLLSLLKLYIRQKTKDGLFQAFHMAQRQLHVHKISPTLHPLTSLQVLRFHASTTEVSRWVIS